MGTSVLPPAQHAAQRSSFIGVVQKETARNSTKKGERVKREGKGSCRLASGAAVSERGALDRRRQGGTAKGYGGCCAQPTTTNLVKPFAARTTPIICGRRQRSPKEKRNRPAASLATAKAASRDAGKKTRRRTAPTRKPTEAPKQRRPSEIGEWRFARVSNTRV